jgi:thiol-disulfide isomerase/thioredoxin
MNNALKIGLGFLAGALAVNSSFVMSNTEDAGDALVSAIANAMYKVKSFEQKQEDEELGKLPNILDCQNMEWMKNCTILNKQAKKNPNAPLRVLSEKGLEYNFVPGTPSSVIRLQLEQTPEAAAAYVTYLDATWGEAKKSAGLAQMEMWKRGPMDNIIGLDRAKAQSELPKKIASDEIVVSAFVQSECGACQIQLTTLETLQKKYPKLKIKVFQVDQNSEAFKTKITQRGLAGRMLSAQEANKVLESGVTKWPTIWIDNATKKSRSNLSGTRSMVQLEDGLQAMSYINMASK